jgi:hypothetical protein
VGKLRALILLVTFLTVVSAGCQHGAPVANSTTASNDLNSPAYWTARADAEHVAGPTSRRSDLADCRAEIYARLGDAPRFHANLAERDRLDLSLTRPTDDGEGRTDVGRWNLAACFALVGDRSEFKRAARAAIAYNELAPQLVEHDLSELGLFDDLAAMAAMESDPGIQVIDYCREAAGAAKVKNWAVYEKAIARAEAAMARDGWNEQDFEWLAGTEVDAGDLVRAAKSVEKCDDLFRAACYADIAKARFKAGDQPGYDYWIVDALVLAAAQKPEFATSSANVSIGEALARAGDEVRLSRASLGPGFSGFGIGSLTTEKLQIVYSNERTLMSAEAGDAETANELLNEVAGAESKIDDPFIRGQFAGLVQNVMLALIRAGKDEAVSELAAHLPEIFKLIDADQNGRDGWYDSLAMAEAGAGHFTAAVAWVNRISDPAGCQWCRTRVCGRAARAGQPLGVVRDWIGTFADPADRAEADLEVALQLVARSKGYQIGLEN